MGVVFCGSDSCYFLNNRRTAQSQSLPPLCTVWSCPVKKAFGSPLTSKRHASADTPETLAKRPAACHLQRFPVRPPNRVRYFLYAFMGSPSNLSGILLQRWIYY